MKNIELNEKIIKRVREEIMMLNFETEMSNKSNNNRKVLLIIVVSLIFVIIYLLIKK